MDTDIPADADRDLVTIVDTFTPRGSDHWTYEAEWLGPREVRLVLSAEAQIVIDRKNLGRVGGVITLFWRGAAIRVASVAQGGAVDLIPVVHSVIIEMLEMPAYASVDDVRRALGPLANLRIE